MALEKQEVIDLVEITESGHVQVRKATRILEDGVVISSSFHRHVIAPGDDYSNEPDKVKGICEVVHTQEVIDAYQSQLQEQEDAA
jgi:predicted transcriptional regulator